MIGPVGLAETISTWTAPACVGPPGAVSTGGLEDLGQRVPNQASRRKRLTKPGPATSARSTSGSALGRARELPGELARRPLLDGASRSATFVA